MNKNLISFYCKLGSNKTKYNKLKQILMKEKEKFKK